jgi:hypothetical protein
MASEVGELVGEVDDVAADEHRGAVRGGPCAGPVGVQLVLIRPFRACAELAAVGLGSIGVIHSGAPERVRRGEPWLLTVVAAVVVR